MTDWFESLDSRERLLVTVAGAFIIFAVFYFAIWTPLDRGQTTLTNSIGNWERSIAELKPLKAALRTGGGTATRRPGANQSMVVIVDTTLRERDLYNSLQRSQPTGDNGIRVDFENAAFDDLVLWLGDLNGTYGIQIVIGSFSVPTQDAPGRVNASLTLER